MSETQHRGDITLIALSGLGARYLKGGMTSFLAMPKLGQVQAFKELNTLNKMTKRDASSCKIGLRLIVTLLL